MNRSFFATIFATLLATICAAQNIEQYNVRWDKPSENSSESMPCGGGDVGMNVWVEGGDLLIYLSRSGTFDENNTLLKLGRVRVRLTPNPFDGGEFRQELCLAQGVVEVEGRKDGITSKITIRADVFSPNIEIDISNNTSLRTELFYENWRHTDRPLRGSESNQNSFKWAAPKGLATKRDSIRFDGNKILFFHRNASETVYDATVAQQGLESVKSQIPNPLKNLTFGGLIEMQGAAPMGVRYGDYANTDYKAWKLESAKPLKSTKIEIKLHTAQTQTIEQWQSELAKPSKLDLKRNLAWWSDFWQRSFIYINSDDPTSKGYEIGRNYTLFRYMLACNTKGDYPTKFNGGLFTYDPVYTDSTMRFTPDFRKWGGGAHTAQNQRLVYFPMLKSGDTDMMSPQFEFYNRLLPVAELRSRFYWGHEGACFTEQLENFGLPNPSEYGWKRPESFDRGMEYNAWLEYQWDTALEFCFMILENNRYTGCDISKYIPLIESTVRFFDLHYQYLANNRGRKTFDGDGKLVLYPGSACETYKMAYNSTSTIAALGTVAGRLVELPEIAEDSARSSYYAKFIERLPEIATSKIEGKVTIAPAWYWERINNTETPQLYPVFPWGVCGLWNDNEDMAINTWRYDPDVIKFRSHVGWKQDAIWAARLGLVDEARELTTLKLENSPRRFPAFWGPGFDWTPDHNWGGSGMIALQEMLVQCNDREIYLLPAWPKEWDVHFKLHLPYNTTIECKQQGGKITLLKVTPESRKDDIVMIFDARQ